MGDLYKQYLDAWAENGGGAMVLFESIGKSSQWGSWGILEAYDQDETTAPKYVAVKEWAAANGQNVTAPKPFLETE